MRVTKVSRLPRRSASPTRLLPGLEVLEDRCLLSVTLVETEPNNTPATADVIDRMPLRQVIVDGRVGPHGDRDWFRVDLRKGDVFGAALRGQGSLNPALRLVDSAGTLLVANDDVDNPYHPGWGQTYLPDESPLPSAHIKTDAEVYYVISTAGTYFLEVTASGDASTGSYEVDTMVARPGLEAKPAGTRQVLFLDFDGASVDFNHFADKASGGTRQLSPLSSFLTEWGLTPADENAVIDAILARVTDNLSAYVQAEGLNDNFGIEILNSRDHPDRFGIDPFVSRIVVGGTSAEAHFKGDVGGTAQGVDVGNFKTDDEAVATLTFIKTGVDLPNHSPNQVVDFVALGAAALVLHEVGHLFGCFHTDLSLGDFFGGEASLMDPYLGPSLTRSLGPDGLFGTSDDLDLRYSMDAYFTDEPYRGRNDTLNTIAFGLSVGKGTSGGPGGVAANEADPSAATNVAWLGTRAAGSHYVNAEAANPAIAGVPDVDLVAKAVPAPLPEGHWQARATSQTITIEVKGDSKKEANETFYLDLFGTSSYALFTRKRGLGTILNDD